MAPRQILPTIVLIGFPIAAVHAQAQFTIVATVLDPATNKPVETLTPAEVTVTEDGATATILKVEPVVQSVKVIRAAAVS